MLIEIQLDTDYDPIDAIQYLIWCQLYSNPMLLDCPGLKLTENRMPIEWQLDDNWDPILWQLTVNWHSIGNALTLNGQSICIPFEVNLNSIGN